MQDKFNNNIDIYIFHNPPQSVSILLKPVHSNGDIEFQGAVVRSTYHKWLVGVGDILYWGGVFCVDYAIAVLVYCVLYGDG